MCYAKLGKSRPMENCLSGFLLGRLTIAAGGDCCKLLLPVTAAVCLSASLARITGALSAAEPD